MEIYISIFLLRKSRNEYKNKIRLLEKGMSIRHSHSNQHLLSLGSSYRKHKKGVNDGVILKTEIYRENKLHIEAE